MNAQHLHGQPMEPLDVHEVALRGTHLVEASAGTGKTWTLCALVLRLVLELDLPVQSILVVTFTKAAAAELRGRIRARLVQAHAALGGEPASDTDLQRIVDNAIQRSGHQAGELRRRTGLALATFDDAAIHTIHGFCQRALVEAAFAAQQPFEQTLQEDDAELRLAAMADVWRREVAHGQLDGQLLAELVRRGDTPAGWSAPLKRLVEAPLAIKQWPAVQPVDAEALALLAAHFDGMRRWWEAQGHGVMAHVHQASQPDGPLAERAHLALESMTAWADYLNQADPLGPLKEEHAKRWIKSAWLQPLIPEEARRLAGALMPLRSSLSRVIATHRSQLQRRLLDAASTALHENKAAQRILTFHDLQARLKERLEGDTGLQGSLRQRYRAALIDEFQDTDDLQLAIFASLFNGTDAPVFMVGDPKQAIYAFRGADLHSYLRARREAPTCSTLLVNQRSSAGLIEGLNTFFTRHAKALGEDGIDYHRVSATPRDKPRLLDLRSSTQSTAALQWCRLPETFNGGKGTRRQMVQLAAQACARAIAEDLRAAARGQLLVVQPEGADDAEDRNVRDRQQGRRPLHGGDIAVIVEKHDQGRLIRDALAAVGVASVDHSRQSVHGTPQAHELALLLRAVDDPGQMGAVRAALATELLGFDAGALTIGHDDAAIDDAIDRLHLWRELWQQRGVAAMLSQVFETTQLAQRLLPRRDGERAMTNWLHLAERLHEAAQEHRRPTELLRWFDQQRNPSTRHVEADEDLLRLASDRKLVQIVTIHRAKGLEYPVVHAPLLWHGSHRTTSAAVATYHDDEGRLVLDFRKSLESEDIDDAIKARVKAEARAEQLRKIYVALTRAALRCVVTFDPHRRQTNRRGKNGDHVADDANLRSMLNWVVAGGGHTIGAWADGAFKIVKGDKGEHEKAQRAELIRAAWDGLRHEAGDAVALCDIEPQPPHWQSLAPDAPPPVVVHQACGPIHADWRMGSFSGWMRMARASATTVQATDWPEQTGSTPGATDEPAPAAQQDAAPHGPLDADPLDILAFPRGPSAGDAVHAMLEAADFAQPATWRQAARKALQRHPQRLRADAQMPGGRAADDGALAAMLENLMAALVATPVRPDLRLDQIAWRDRVSELEFDLHVPDAALPAFIDTLRAKGLGVPALGADVHAERLRGHLRGFIDGVFVHQGRHHLVDWKSNHLGDTRQAYAAAALEREMALHGYHLQHAIYAVALWRQLCRRHGRDGADARWGGAMVFFVRGVRPAWKDDQGRPCGVVDVRLDAQTLDTLSRQLGEDS